ncbi:exonuclease 1, partial [Kipferlia bialata]
GDREGAFQHFKGAVTVTQTMVRETIRQIRQRCPSVTCIVSPYEADAQLCYLAQTGQVDFVVTEDSDLLVFGCTRVMFKYNKHTGTGDYIVRDLDSPSAGCLHGMSPNQFRDTCIISGCDYAQSVSGIGLKTAAKLVRQGGDAAGAVSLLMESPKYSAKVPDGYMGLVERAQLTFRHQTVYDTVNRCLRPMTEIPSRTRERIHAHTSECGTYFLGPLYEADIAQKVAGGEADARTLGPIADILSADPTESMSLFQTPPPPPLPAHLSEGSLYGIECTSGDEEGTVKVLKARVGGHSCEGRDTSTQSRDVIRITGLEKELHATRKRERDLALRLRDMMQREREWQAEREQLLAEISTLKADRATEIESSQVPDGVHQRQRRKNTPSISQQLPRPPMFFSGSRDRQETVSPDMTDSGVPMTNRTFIVRSALTGLILTVKPSLFRRGNLRNWTVEMQPRDPSNIGQVFVYNRDHTISTWVNTGYVLDAKGGHGGNGSVVQLYPRHTNPNQVWEFEDGAIVCGTPERRVLDVQGNKAKPGTRVIIWNRHNRPNQRWSVEYVTEDCDTVT